MDLKAVATHPEPRGQMSSPILFFLIAGIGILCWPSSSFPRSITEYI